MLINKNQHILYKISAGNGLEKESVRELESFIDVCYSFEQYKSFMFYTKIKYTKVLEKEQLRE